MSEKEKQKNELRPFAEIELIDVHNLATRMVSRLSYEDEQSRKLKLFYQELENYIAQRQEYQKSVGNLLSREASKIPPISLFAFLVTFSIHLDLMLPDLITSESEPIVLVPYVLIALSVVVYFMYKTDDSEFELTISEFDLMHSLKKLGWIREDFRYLTNESILNTIYDRLKPAIDHLATDHLIDENHNLSHLSLDEGGSLDKNDGENTSSQQQLKR